MSHAIIVVHGVGDHQKTDTLRVFANGFIDFIYERLRMMNVPLDSLKVRVDLQDPKEPHVTVSYAHGGLQEDFFIRETWWAKSFQPPDLTSVGLWTLWLMLDRARESLRALPSWNPVTWLYALALLIAMPVAAFLIFLLIFGLRLILAIPLLNQPTKAVITGFQKRAADFLVLVVGDIQVYATDWVYSTGILQGLEAEIDKVSARNEVTDICVVGHSLGSLIAYECLSRTLPPSPKSKVRLLVTVGSPLEKVDLFLAEAYEFRLQQHLPDYIQWINIYSPTDLISSLVQARGAGPKNTLVRNKPIFLFFKEHSGYWRNLEVMDVIVGNVASASRLGSPLPPPPPKNVAEFMEQMAKFYLPHKLFRR